MAPVDFLQYIRPMVQSLVIRELTNVNATMNDGNGEEVVNEDDEYEEEERLTKRKAC